MTDDGSATGARGYGATSEAFFGPVAPIDLVDTRRQLHHAALLISAVGRTLAPKQAGFRHAALFWDDDRHALVGAEIAAEAGARMRAQLVLEPPAISFASAGDGLDGGAAAPSWSTPLSNVTIDSAWLGLRDAVGAAGIPGGGSLAIRFPSDLPDHPLRSGEAFAADIASCRSLARWFAFADDVLTGVARPNHAVLPVPCWGDHFDMAVVVPRAEDASITLGFSPGDDSIPEPYLYVLPWPVPGPARLPGAPVHARWHTKGWVGLALDGTTLAALPDPQAAGRAFLQEGFEIVQDLLLTEP